MNIQKAIPPEDVSASDDCNIGAHLRFSLDRSTPDLILLAGKNMRCRSWLDGRDVNKLLNRAQTSPHTKELLVELLARCYGAIMLHEETRSKLKNDAIKFQEQIAHLKQKCALLQEKLGSEEEAKRRTLLRYIRAVKNSSSTCRTNSSEVKAIELPESAISDEELHAIAALLRCDTTIEELSPRDNRISDDGAHALASVLAGKSSLKSIDLRGNMITHNGVRIIAEALERSDRVRHVYVHAGGKVEALGFSQWPNPEKSSESP